MLDFWNWLTATEQGTAARIAAGVSIFAVLAIVDLRRRGKNATRWREYAFLLAVVGLAMSYGAVNDLITSRISWEYFVYGKNLLAILGPRVPPDPSALAGEAAKVGLKATWSAGLIIGAAMLVANNPRPGLPQLPYRRMLRLIGPVFTFCIMSAVVLGIAGYCGRLSWISEDFRQMVLRDEFRPFRFLAVFGVHLGGYVGGIAGTIWAAIVIRRARKGLPISADPGVNNAG